MDNLFIEEAFENRNDYTPQSAPTELKITIDEIISKLDSGIYRIAEKKNNIWIVHEWLRKAILLAFKIYPNQVFSSNYCQFYDKLPLKFNNYQSEDFAKNVTRIVPHAIIRKGAYLGKNTVIMPSYINIGAYVDDGAMIDTWATVGSCAQIGKNVHLSGGAGIGGVLEPLQAKPTIIEDNCFIGARSEIVEGVIVEQDSVISMGNFIGQSTKIYNRLTKEITYGRIPAGSVVVPGSLPSKDGQYSLACAIIVKQVDAKTLSKTSINELLRDYDY